MTALINRLSLLAAASLTSLTAQADMPSTRVMGNTAAPLELRMTGALTSRLATPPAEAQRRVAPAPEPVKPLPASGQEYRIGNNDLLEVEVLDVENLKRSVRVNSSGTVSLPLIGYVTLAGLTAQQAEQTIADRYREKYLQDPQVSVFIKEFTTERITIEGAVFKPGIFPLQGNMTLLRVLAMAGGFGPMALSSEVKLYRVDERKVRQVVVYDIEKIRAGKNEDPVVKGDDLIVVQRDPTRALLKDSVFRDVIDSVNPFSVFTR